MKSRQCTWTQTKLDYVLDTFETITLKEMDNVKLMDRVETKYVMNYTQLIEVLQKLVPHYKILMVENIKKNKYQTHYFDTPDFKMYKKHHNGIVNRYKIRTREYVDTGLLFTEVKFKNNKKKTIKKRIKTKNKTALNQDSQEFVENKSSFNGNELRFALENTYSRLTFVHKQNRERLTIDLDLEYRNNKNETLTLEGIVVAEVKQEKLSHKSDFKNIMHEMHIRSRGFSKYCMGVSFLYSNAVKNNNFKENKLFLKKISKGERA